MDPRVFRRVQRYGWDAATDAYDRGWVPLIEGLTASCVARAAPRPGERVLDLATGTGVGAFVGGALAVGAGGLVTGHRRFGKDGDAGELARRATRGVGNVVFQRNDMEATGAPDGAFDAVTCAFGLMFAADRAAAFAEIARVTAAGRAGVGLRLGAACRLRLRRGVPDRRRPRRERGLPAVLRARCPGRADRVVRTRRADGRGRGDASR